MIAALSLSNDSRTTVGILLLMIVAVEFGGLTVLRIVRGHQPRPSSRDRLRLLERPARCSMKRGLLSARRCRGAQRWQRRGQ